MLRLLERRRPRLGAVATRALVYSSADQWQRKAAPAFRSFLKLKKHLIVPVPFRVPDGDEVWPKETWGYPLGKHAAWLRKQWRAGGNQIDPMQRKELDEMPFAWDNNQYRWDHFVLPALRRFYELNGHTDVPKAFRIQEGDPEWPQHLWGQRLGDKVAAIRSRGYFARKFWTSLDRLNFCHDSKLSDRDWREKLVPALRVYRQEFGHCDVPKDYMVPSSSPWPKAAWEMRLGNAVSKLHCNTLGVARDKSELDELRFVWNHSENEWTERILPALEVFYQERGHCRVPGKFEVPSDEKWPKQTWGLKLGFVVAGIRSSRNYYSIKFPGTGLD